jgi:hypothetical protein
LKGDGSNQKMRKQVPYGWDGFHCYCCVPC